MIKIFIYWGLVLAIFFKMESIEQGFHSMTWHFASMQNGSWFAGILSLFWHQLLASEAFLFAGFRSIRSPFSAIWDLPVKDLTRKQIHDRHHVDESFLHQNGAEVSHLHFICWHACAPLDRETAWMVDLTRWSWVQVVSLWIFACIRSWSLSWLIGTFVWQVHEPQTRTVKALPTTGRRSGWLQCYSWWVMLGSKWSRLISFCSSWRSNRWAFCAARDSSEACLSLGPACLFCRLWTGNDCIEQLFYLG